MHSKVLWSVIIPSHNSSPRLKEIINKLVVCSKHTNTLGEVLVIDDKSTNNFDYSSLLNSNLNVMVIHNKHNLGQCKSENLGASKAIGKLLIFLDDDCKPSDDYFISKIIQSYEDGKKIIAGSIFTISNNTSIERVRFPIINIEKDMVVGPNGLQGGCFAIDKQVFIKIGGFSDDLDYFYDIDLGYKINSEGHDINKFKDISVVHFDKNINLKNELKKTYNSYKSSYQTIVGRYPKSKSSFYWGTTLSERDLIKDKIAFHKYIFKFSLLIYNKIYKYLPRLISVEIYNYLHRCMVYYGVKGMKYL